MIAEILLAGIEKDENLKSFLTVQPSFRLVDDLIVGFEDEAQARKCLTAVRRAMWKVNFQLPDEKTIGCYRRAQYSR